MIDEIINKKVEMSAGVVYDTDDAPRSNERIIIDTAALLDYAFFIICEEIYSAANQYELEHEDHIRERVEFILKTTGLNAFDIFAVHMKAYHELIEILTKEKIEGKKPIDFIHDIDSSMWNKKKNYFLIHLYNKKEETQKRVSSFCCFNILLK
jgi:hypothetical protein